ncbi:hypothetical protein LMG28614_04131 [Paraburkholderia ultramafica]|uniref:Uncharacterized protein n=1 Tax=Paraburkholderia ultramafica TaxID=1544867 RepID=A0A6S7BC69_9BURK|nr:hypothetical protein [Paraburkholderia ultramafica]CAB3795237.1 hypothetical protein LMG28614_04131 [Paraburkholderia ultramafica]
MVKRSKVGHHLADAWESVIQSEYCTGHINSERSLQGHLFAELLQRMRNANKPSRQIFIEPRIDLGEERRIVRPDIVICNANSVICVVELKYAPRGKAETEKDMRSIGAIAADQTIKISVERYLGPHIPSKEYSISSTTLFAWAGVHKGSGQQSEVWTEDDRFANHYFLELHALTRADAEPRLVCNTNAFRRPTGYEAP